MSKTDARITFRDSNGVQYTIEDAAALVRMDATQGSDLYRWTPAGKETFFECARRMRLTNFRDTLNVNTAITFVIAGQLELDQAVSSMPSHCDKRLFLHKLATRLVNDLTTAGSAQARNLSCLLVEVMYALNAIEATTNGAHAERLITP